MVCNLCKQKEAKVHFTQIVENEVKKIDLCEACAKDKGLNDTTTFAIADMLLGLSAPQQIEESAEPKGPDISCPNCGFTQAEFKKSARLGCCECYAVFGASIAPLLKTMHKGVQHRGKTPQATPEIAAPQVQLSDLEKDLQSAIDREDFEQAAILRDRLKVIRTGGQTRV